jgi:nitroimidazol reductase NimA-like FMN-containing flavoprotein (pyridoxamine 5'-phosphate oxidase superfamily)
MTAMTETEKQEYLADLHVGVLSLNNDSKGPLTAPIWYDYEPGGELWFITGPNSLKGKLLDVGVRLSLVAQSEDPPYKYVSVEGPVVSIDESTKDDLLAMAVRYLGDDGGRQYAENSNTSGGIIVRVKPERWLCVDYGKN